MEGSDEALAARVAMSGDVAAFEELVRRHQSRLRNWLRQLTRDATLADDLAQDTFIRAWGRIGSFQARGPFASWLMKIAYNCFLQSLRGRQRDRKLTDAIETELAEPRVTTDSTELADLQKLLGVLSADERVAMTLCYAHGMSHGEIAELTQMPLGTVKSHIRRGKRRIRERFDLGTGDE